MKVIHQLASVAPNREAPDLSCREPVKNSGENELRDEKEYIIAEV